MIVVTIQMPKFIMTCFVVFVYIVVFDLLMFVSIISKNAFKVGAYYKTLKYKSRICESTGTTTMSKNISATILDYYCRDRYYLAQFQASRIHIVHNRYVCLCVASEK